MVTSVWKVIFMPKYLIEGSYTAEGVKGLQSDKASGRRAAVTRAVEALGGKLECIYFMFGDADVMVIVDMPDNAAASSLCLSLAGTGRIRTKTRTLLTVEEVDKALAQANA